MNNLKRFFYLLDSQAKKKIPMLVAAFLLSSILDVIGVGLIGFFLALMTNQALLIQKIPFLSYVLQRISEKQLIIISGLLIITAFVSKALITYQIQTKIVYFCYSLAVRIKLRMMTAYQNAPYTFHLQKNSAYLISRIQDNVNGYVNAVLLPAINLISSSLITISILFFLFILHPFLTLFLITTFFMIGLIFDLLVRKKISALGKIAALSNGEMIKCVHQGLYGFTEVQVLGRENYFLQLLKKEATRYAQAASSLAASQQVPKYLIENMIAIFIIGLSMGGIAAGYNMGTIVAIVGMFAAAGARLLPAVTQIMSTVNQMRGGFYHAHLLYDELFELNSIPNRFHSLEYDKLDFKKIELTNLKFSYPDTEYSALENINLAILRGQSIGLIGSSGAGKSTLVNIMLGFLEPIEGNLAVDGKPVTNARAWLNNFAYIPQTIFLLDDTLRRNIAFGIDEEDINEDQVWNAIKMAQLIEVVNNLPQGINTLLGENGVRLSGGQRQRVALARAFYFERDVIIMDEATSSLDNETEREVINTIKRLKGKKTLIVIAHRLSTVEHCDVLYKLEKGKIAAVGTFKEVVGVTH